MSVPDGVLAMIRDVIAEHMTDPDECLDWCCVQRILVVGESGRILADDEWSDGDTPAALLLMTRDGSEVRVTVTRAVRST